MYIYIIFICICVFHLSVYMKHCNVPWQHDQEERHLFGCSVDSLCGSGFPTDKQSYSLSSGEAVIEREWTPRDQWSLLDLL